MDIGMLWFDNDPKSEIDQKIERAASYYRDKYGKSPNVCFIHPSMIAVEGEQEGENHLQSGDIKVRTSATVLPNHFWIGVNGSN